MDAKSTLLLVYFIISSSFLKVGQSLHGSSLPCNVSSTESCPASLYYVPETSKTLEETASLFNVNPNVVNRTMDDYLIGINCSCPRDHDEYVWHVNYKIQHGDTWEKVSSKFGSFVLEKKDKTLIPTQIVTLDLLCSCSKSFDYVLTYKVESGDTLFRICSRFQADLDKTAMFNRIENPNLIYAGDVIFIPGPGKRN